MLKYIKKLNTFVFNLLSMNRIALAITFICFSSLLSGQKNQVKIATVGFYNLENLFDTVDDTLIRDEEFLPDGRISSLFYFFLFDN